MENENKKLSLEDLKNEANRVEEEDHQHHPRPARRHTTPHHRPKPIPGPHHRASRPNAHDHDKITPSNHSAQ